VLGGGGVPAFADVRDAASGPEHGLNRYRGLILIALRGAW